MILEQSDFDGKFWDTVFRFVDLHIYICILYIHFSPCIHKMVIFLDS